MRVASRWTLAGAAGVLAVSSVGLTRFGAPLRAEPADVATAVSTESAAADNRTPAVSDNGAVIAFEVTESEAARVDIVDRVAATTTSVPTAGARLPAVSGGGCVVAYVVPSDTSTALWAHDRCTEDDADNTVELATFDSPLDGAAAPPALSGDGAVIAWSTGGEIVTFERTDDQYVAGPRFDTSPSGGDDVTAGPVAVAADGSTVAFVAGPGDAPYVPSPSNVFVADLALVAVAAAPEATTNAGDDTGAELESADDPAERDEAGEAQVRLDRVKADASDAVDGAQHAGGAQQAVDGGITLVSATIDGAPASGLSSNPSLSSDGSLVVFDSTSTDLAAMTGATPDGLGTTFIVMVDRDAGTSLLAADGAAPDLSPDGRHVVYQTLDAIRTITWLDDGGEGAERPFGRILDELTVPTIGSAATDEPVPAGPAVTRPRISGFGRYVVFDSERGADLVVDPQHHASNNVFATERRPELQGDPLDLGDAAPGTELAGDVVFENTGPSGVDLAEVEASAGLIVSGSTCVGVIDPGARCTVSLTATMPESRSIEGVVQVSSTTWDAVTFLADVVGGQPASAPDTTTTTTTTTLPPTPTTPRPTTPRTTPATTTTTVPGSALVSAVPAVVDFAPTIITAGRRVVAVTITNTSSDTSRSVAVGAVTISGDTSFAIVSDGCAGSALTGGGSCSIEVDFAPQVAGEVTGVLAVELDDDGVLSVPLSGIGAATPILEVVPNVAAQGQVVTVFGSGFPAGAGVELVVGRGPVERQRVQVDDSGRLTTSVLIMPHTPAGPLPVTVQAQPDLFPNVADSVLVGNDPSRSAAAFGGLGPRIGR